MHVYNYFFTNATVTRAVTGYNTHFNPNGTFSFQHTWTLVNCFTIFVLFHLYFCKALLLHAEYLSITLASQSILLMRIIK